jgi:Ran GTPase-activating protein (RanGAP) involved in mRNA processing and transport
LQPGSKVQLHGLTNSKELNGLTGNLLEFDATKVRWGVKLENGKQVSLKMGNLLPLSTELEPAVEIPHLGPTVVEQAPKSGGYAGSVADSTSPVSYARAAATAAKAESQAAVEPSAEQLAFAKAAAMAASTSEVTGVESSTPSATKHTCEAEVPVAKFFHPTESSTDDLKPTDDEEWPVLPTSAETKAKIQSGCWWDGGSTAKRFAAQLIENDPKLVSVALVPPKRFNDDDARDICDALEVNSCCRELIASGHPLSEESCKRLARMLHTNKTLQMLSVGESSLGDLACVLFEGLAQNVSLTSLDLEHKGLTLKACQALGNALKNRKENLKEAAPMSHLRLSRNAPMGTALAEGVEFEAPKELLLCECSLTPAHAQSLGLWASKGVEDLNLRGNSSFGGDGVEAFLRTLVSTKGTPAPPLRKLRLDHCSIGDDGLEAIADALQRGLGLEDLWVEHCEITLAGCEFLRDGMLGRRRLHTLSVRANVIGDEGCTLLAPCAENIDVSATNLSGQILSTLGKLDLTSLELFSNPTLGPSVSTWCSELDIAEWQRLEYLDLTGCGLQTAGFECVLNTLMQKQALMPNLTTLLIGANDVKEDDSACELVDHVCESRGGKLSIKWQNS